MTSPERMPFTPTEIEKQIGRFRGAAIDMVRGWGAENRVGDVPARTVQWTDLERHARVALSVPLDELGDETMVPSLRMIVATQVAEHGSSNLIYQFPRNRNRMVSSFYDLEPERNVTMIGLVREPGRLYFPELDPLEGHEARIREMVALNSLLDDGRTTLEDRSPWGSGS